MNVLTTNVATNVAADISLHGITKSYGQACVLNSVDLRIAAGEFLTLLGPSGSGKSTLLMTLAGFVEPSHGNIFIGNRSIISVVPEKRDFGVVFQGYALFPHMTVEENIAYPLKVRRTAKADIAMKVKQALDLVQLSALASRYPRQLSGGQQQRVALARALVFSPKVLLLDEPMGALDKNLRQDLQVELRQLHKRLGRTFVNVTHDQEEAMAMSDRIAVMRDGRIVQIGRPRDLYDLPKTRFVAAFLGKSNFVEGEVTEVAAGVAKIETTNGPITHAVGSAGAAVATGARVTLALRPQKVRLGPGLNSHRTKVESAVFLGTHAEVAFRSASGHQLVAQIALREALDLPAEGEDAEISWAPESTVIVDAD